MSNKDDKEKYLIALAKLNAEYEATTGTILGCYIDIEPSPNPREDRIGDAYEWDCHKTQFILLPAGTLVGIMKKE